MVLQCRMHCPTSLKRSSAAEFRLNIYATSISNLYQEIIKIEQLARIQQSISRLYIPIKNGRAKTNKLFGGKWKMIKKRIYQKATKNEEGKLMVCDDACLSSNLLPTFILYYSNLLQLMEDDSSKEYVPPLPLSTGETHCLGKPHNEMKQRMRMTLTNIVQLPLICEEPSDRLSTDRSSISLAQMRTLRAMRINAVRDLSEEECMRRYANDPFFRWRVTSEMRSLAKVCSRAQLPTNQTHSDVPPLLKTTKLIEQECDTTYRKVKLDDVQESLASKNRLEHVVSEVRLRINEGKENKRS